MYLRGPEKSHYESKDINIYINDPDFGTTGYYIKCEQSPIGCGFKDAVLHTTKIDGIEYLKLDLSGTLWLQKISTLQAGHFPIQATIYCKK